jgi:hypothetical protein
MQQEGFFKHKREKSFKPDREILKVGKWERQAVSKEYK